jgi:hypothetical protein
MGATTDRVRMAAEILATINGTRVRFFGRRNALLRWCDSSGEGLTGATFGTKIWTRIDGCCLGHMQAKTMSSINEEKLIFVRYRWRRTEQVVF